jgi:glycosyltransferase involved in cell wall biosynthesis
MTKRLCMVVHGPYPIGEPRVLREARVALARGYDVHVFAMARRGEALTELLDGVRVSRVPMMHARGMGLSRMLREYGGFTVRAALHLVRHRYDVVHVHNPPDFLIAAALVPKLRRSRVLFDVHDLSPDMFSMRFEGRRFQRAAEWVLRRIERLACRFADRVITVHEPYRQELIARGADAQKVVVVMNSLDEQLLPPVVDRPDSSPFEVVYHGTITPHYGVSLLVEAFARIRDAVPAARLALLGEGDALADVEARIDRLGLRSAVTLSYSYLPQHEALERIRGASVGVIPNLPIRLNRFALSTKLLEYCALRVPVVCADLPTIRAHFGDAELRFFRAGDVAALAEALMDVASNPAAAEARVASAAERSKLYSWSHFAERYGDLLEAAAS